MRSPTQDPVVDTLSTLLEAQEDAATAHHASVARLIEECHANMRALPPSVQAALRALRKTQDTLTSAMHAVGEHDV